MTKKEKIAAVLMMLTMVLLITSYIYTVISNKPAGYSFNIERLYYNLKKS